MLGVLLVLVSLIVICLVASFIYDGRPLSQTEVATIAQQRRLDAVWYRIGWTEQRFDPSDFRKEKKSMRARGGTQKCEESTSTFPNYAAALLKGKKHEWWIAGWSIGGQISDFWCNKGPDGTKVYPGLSKNKLQEVASMQGCELVIDVHNHPNPDPSKFICIFASDADLVHSRLVGEYLSKHEVAYLAFVAERGMSYPYAIYIPRSWSPLQANIDDVTEKSALSRSNRREMRRSFRASTPFSYLKRTRVIHNLDQD